MNSNRHSLFKPLLFCLGLLLPFTSVQAKQLDLRLNLAKPVMSAEVIQTALVKISLTGQKEHSEGKRIAANIAIVLDKSGSMDGEKLFQAKQAAIMAIKRLNPDDIVSVVSYDTQVKVVVPATKARDVESISQAIRSIQANGNTALFAGVSKGAQELRKFLDLNKVNRVILLSDGLANVGPSSPHDLGQLGLSLAQEGMSVTTIGLGLGYNEDLMTQLAGYSDGNHAFVEKPSDLARIFQYEFGDVMSVVAQGVQIQIHCKNGVRPLRVIGREAIISGNRVNLSMNQLYSEQEKFIILEVEVPAQKDRAQVDLLDVNVQYLDLIAEDRKSQQADLVANFSLSDQQVKSAIDKDTYESAAEQIANELNRQAVKKRDQGDIEGAKSILQQSADYLDGLGNSLASPKLLEQKQEALQDAEEIESEAEWNKTRKALKERQYKRAKQQTY